MDARIFFGFAEYVRGNDGRWTLRLRKRKIALAAFVFSAVAYLAGVSAAYFRERVLLGRKTTASFSEIALVPVSAETRSRRRARQASALVEAAKRTESPEEALALVRSGLARNSANPDGRLFFSHVLFYQRRFREAAAFLSDGLAGAGTHPDYVRFFVRRCLDCGEDAAVVEAAEKYATDENFSKENRFALVVGAARAEIFRGRFAEAQARLERPPLAGTPSADFLAAHIARERGNVRAAAALLLRVRERFSSPELELALARDFFALGETETARRFLVSAETCAPVCPPPVRVGILATLSEMKFSGAAEMLAKRIEDFFETCGNDADAMRQLAAFATEKGDAALAGRCLERARAAAFPSLPDFALLRIEALLTAGERECAREILDEIFASPPVWFTSRAAALNGLRAVALFSVGDNAGARLCLEKATFGSSLTTPQTVALARRLFACGNAPEAFRLLEIRLETEPESIALLQEILALAIRSRAAETFVRFAPRLARSRRPSRDFLERAAAFARSDALIFFPQRESLDALFSEMLGR